MKQLLRIIIGFFLGLTSLAGGIVMGLLIYDSVSNFVGIIIFFVLVVLSLWLGVQIFKAVQQAGLINFMTAIHATPELDNLEPSKDSQTKLRNPEELIQSLNSNERLAKGGTIRIFGDWFGKPYDKYHELVGGDFNDSQNLLTLHFKEGETLDIYNPEHIFEAPTFLKIVKASRIRFTWYYYGRPKSEENRYYLDYKLVGSKIITDTNVDWYKPKFHTSLGDPALMLYG